MSKPISRPTTKPLILFASFFFAAARNVSPGKQGPRKDASASSTNGLQITTVHYTTLKVKML